MNKWLELAARLAKESRHSKKMAAVVVKGGRVLALACNYVIPGRHAEIRALGRRKCGYEGATLIVMRDGGGVSKPCRMCFKRIQETGVSRIVFTNEEGRIVQKRVKEEDPRDYKYFVV